MLPHAVLHSSDAAKLVAAAALKRTADRARKEMRKEVKRSSLMARHARLEFEILTERQRPRPDEARISQLKLEKLYVKEAIEAMKAGIDVSGSPTAAGGPVAWSAADAR